jgi:thymidylate synthase
MNKLDSDYLNLLSDILSNGVDKEDRTGTGTISIFGHQFVHSMSDGFPLLTTKKMAVKTMMTELKWFLKGRTDIQYLKDNNCKIWDGDYEKSGRTDGTLGPIYGKQWRSWGEYEAGYPESQIDQIKNLIEQLKTNPDSRRLMVSAWNVGELDQMVLPPCHYGFQVYTRELNMVERMEYALSKNNFRFTDAIINQENYEKYNIPTRAISLMWNQRSVDTFLGLPFNIASYGTLLLLLAQEVSMIPEHLIGSLGDVHLYQNHTDQAYEQLTRKPYPNLPKIKLSNVDILNGEFDYEILNYNHHDRLVAPLSN